MKAPRRIAYYLWRYPCLSETFIQRELTALKADPALDVVVLADAPDDLDALDEQARALVADTQYLFPLDGPRFVRALLRACAREPVSLLRLFFYGFTHRYQHRRSPIHHLRVVLKVTYLAELLRARGITHLHTPWADVNAFVGLWAARLAKIPFSLQTRAHDLHRTSSAYALEEKFGAAQFVVTNTRYNLTHVQSLVEERAWSKIHQIYNGIPLDAFSHRRNGKPASQPFRILAVGRLVEQKGYVHLLKACARLRDQGFSFHCKIIGGPELPTYAAYYRRLMTLHRDLGLAQWVTFSMAQPFDAVLEAYRRSDLFVLPCILAKDGSRDIIPNALIEAMAMELPVLSTTVTGVPEIVDDGTNGLLIPPHDEQILAETMIRLMDDAPLREHLGKNARKKVEDTFDIKHTIQRYIALFTAHA